MGMTADWSRTRWRAAAGVLAAVLTVATPSAVPAVAATTDPVDEVMYAYGDTPGSGLTPGATYHYRIGTNGLDHTLRAAPTGNFTAVDIGDTASTRCDPWMARQQALIAAQAPDFVTHGGDISYANECGAVAVHQYFLDQQVWSTGAAFQPAWGNHEYGQVTSESLPGAVADSLANYKGRIPLTHAQTLTTDSATRTSTPGCAGPYPGNNCRGGDWGWFQVGGVLSISYPEPWPNAYRDWLAAAQVLMARAQADPGVDFIVTYGHRPAFSSAATLVNADLLSAITALSAQYSPTAAHPQGKYVLTIGHHVHAEEVFAPLNGLVAITNGGGGAGQVNFSTVAPGSILRVRHPAIMRSDYDRGAHTLTVRLLCGTAYTPNPKDPCTYGSTLYSRVFLRPAG